MDLGSSSPLPPSPPFPNRLPTRQSAPAPSPAPQPAPVAPPPAPAPVPPPVAPAQPAAFVAPQPTPAAPPVPPVPPRPPAPPASALYESVVIRESPVPPPPRPLAPLPPQSPLRGASVAPVSVRAGVPAAPAAPAKPRRRWWRFLACVFVILVALAAGAYFWLFRGGESVVPSAAARVLSHESFGANAEVAVQLSSPATLGASGGWLKLAVAADIDRADASGPAAQGSASLGVEVPEGVTTLSASYRLVDGKLYVRVSGAPEGVRLGGVLPGNEWVAISAGDAAALGEARGGAEPLAALAAAAQVDAAAAMGALLAGEAVEWGSRPEILYVDGAWVREYRFSVSRDALIDALALAAPGSREGLQATVGRVEFGQGSAQVALLGGELRALELPFTVSAPPTLTRGAPVVPGHFRLSFRDFGLPVSVVAPDGAAELGDLSDAAPAELASSTVAAASAANAAARSFRERGGSYEGFCASAWSSSTLAAEPGLSVGACRADADGFAVILAASDGLWCVDAAGVTVASTSTLSSASCAQTE